MSQSLRRPGVRAVRRRVGRVYRKARKLYTNNRNLPQVVRRTLSRARVPSGDRLVPVPVFVVSSVRSGSTLLRVLLNSHSKVHAPHELHLRTLQIKLGKNYSTKAIEAIDLDVEELEHLLWDRILHRELQRSGKDLIVEKTPGNALIWSRLRRAWPNARYIFLLRHPTSMVNSLISGRPDRDYDKTVREVHGYVKKVEEARQSLDGLTVRYEDLTADPTAVTKQICGFLGVPWEQSMLNYGKKEHGPYKAGIGDWSANIKSGTVNPGKPLPTADEVPALLRDVTGKWGYEV